MEPGLQDEKNGFQWGEIESAEENSPFVKVALTITLPNYNDETNRWESKIYKGNVYFTFATRIPGDIESFLKNPDPASLIVYAEGEIVDAVPGEYLHSYVQTKFAPKQLFKGKPGVLIKFREEMKEGEFRKKFPYIDQEEYKKLHQRKEIKDHPDWLDVYAGKSSENIFEALKKQMEIQLRAKRDVPDMSTKHLLYWILVYFKLNEIDISTDKKIDSCKLLDYLQKHEILIPLSVLHQYHITALQDKGVQLQRDEKGMVHYQLPPLICAQLLEKLQKPLSKTQAVKLQDCNLDDALGYLKTVIIAASDKKEEFIKQHDFPPEYLNKVAKDHKTALLTTGTSEGGDVKAREAYPNSQTHPVPTYAVPMQPFSPLFVENPENDPYGPYQLPATTLVNVYSLPSPEEFRAKPGESLHYLQFLFMQRELATKNRVPGFRTTAPGAVTFRHVPLAAIFAVFGACAQLGMPSERQFNISMFARTPGHWATNKSEDDQMLHRLNEIFAGLNQFLGKFEVRRDRLTLLIPLLSKNVSLKDTEIQNLIEEIRLKLGLYDDRYLREGVGIQIFEEVFGEHDGVKVKGKVLSFQFNVSPSILYKEVFAKLHRQIILEEKIKTGIASTAETKESDQLKIEAEQKIQAARKSGEDQKEGDSALSAPGGYGPGHEGEADVVGEDEKLELENHSQLTAEQYALILSYLGTPNEYHLAHDSKSEELLQLLIRDEATRGEFKTKLKNVKSLNVSSQFAFNKYKNGLSEEKRQSQFFTDEELLDLKDKMLDVLIKHIKSHPDEALNAPIFFNGQRGEAAMNWLIYATSYFSKALLAKVISICFLPGVKSAFKYSNLYGFSPLFEAAMTNAPPEIFVLLLYGCNVPVNTLSYEAKGELRHTVLDVYNHRLRGIDDEKEKIQKIRDKKEKQVVLKQLEEKQKSWLQVKAILLKQGGGLVLRTHTKKR